MAEDYEVVVEESGFRTLDVEGAIVTSMGIIQAESGGLRAFIDFDDDKGMATYNLTVKDEPAGKVGEDGKYIIPGYLDIGKIISSLQKVGVKSFVNIPNKVWRTEPDIIGQQIWIKCLVTSKTKDNKEYKGLIEVTKLGSETAKPKQPAQGKTTPPPAKGALTPELQASWEKAIDEVLTEPLNEAGIQQAIKAKYPGKENEAFRKSLADVRAKALAAMTKSGKLEMDENAKYTIAV